MIRPKSPILNLWAQTIRHLFSHCSLEMVLLLGLLNSSSCGLVIKTYYQLSTVVGGSILRSMVMSWRLFWVI